MVVPSEGYHVGVRRLCDKYNVLYIADEVRTYSIRHTRVFIANNSNFFRFKKHVFAAVIHSDE